MFYVAGLKPHQYFYHRGFVSHATLPFPDLLTHAAALFAQHPIERVTIAGALISHTRDGRYYIRGSEVPYQIWDHVVVEFHLTEADALLALSTACVSYGRQAANLPPLPQTTPA